MPNYNPCIRGQAFRFFVGLTSQADPTGAQVNPSIAAGDAKVSKDGGALANLATLPTVTPASSKMVQVDLSAAEMDADNVTVVLSDAAGSEWVDLIVNIQPSSLGFTGSVNDAGAIATSFVTTITGKGTDFFKDSFLLFTDGALQGQSRKISAYNTSTGAITVATAFSSAPANSDPFIILGRSE